MSYLLDTNVLSELVRKKPSIRVVRWLEDVPDDALHLSTLTLGEIRKGVERLPRGRRREKLRLWLERELPDWFEGRVLPVDTAVAERWGRLLATLDRPAPAIDGLIAATALQHGLRLVTRNEADVSDFGLDVVNPWNA